MLLVFLVYVALKIYNPQPECWVTTKLWSPPWFSHISWKLASVSLQSQRLKSRTIPSHSAFIALFNYKCNSQVFKVNHSLHRQNVKSALRVLFYFQVFYEHRKGDTEAAHIESSKWGLSFLVHSFAWHSTSGEYWITWLFSNISCGFSEKLKLPKLSNSISFSYKILESKTITPYYFLRLFISSFVSFSSLLCLCNQKLIPIISKMLSNQKDITGTIFSCTDSKAAYCLKRVSSQKMVPT